MAALTHPALAPRGRPWAAASGPGEEPEAHGLEEGPGADLYSLEQEFRRRRELVNKFWRGPLKP